MARIPRATELAGAQQTRSVVNVPVIEESQAPARALDQAGKVLFDFGNRLQQSEIDQKVTAANRNTREQLDLEYRKLADATDVDPAEFEPRYREATDKIISANAQSIPSAGRSLWSQRAKDWQSDALIRTRGLTRERQIEGAKTAHITTAAQLDLTAGDLRLTPETYAANLNDARALVRNDVARGMIGPDDGALRLARLDEIGEKDRVSRKRSTIDGMVRSGDTAGAIALIESSPTFEERDQMLRVMDAVENDEYQKKQRARQEREQAQVEINRTASKDLDEQIFSGKLTADWLRRNRDRMSEGDYSRGFTQLGNITHGEVDSSPSILADLTYRSAAGEDVSVEARAALTQGHLSRTDAASIIARSGNNVEQPSWSKRGLDYISNSLKPSDLNDDPFRNIRYARAVEEWRGWVDQQQGLGKLPTREESQKEMDAIVKSYSLVNEASSMALALPAPRGLGRRPQNGDDLKEAQRILQTQADSLKPEELQQQLTLLQQWGEALKSKPAAGAKK